MPIFNSIYPIYITTRITKVGDKHRDPNDRATIIQTIMIEVQKRRRAMQCQCKTSKNNIRKQY